LRRWHALNVLVEARYSAGQQWKVLEIIRKLLVFVTEASQFLRGAHRAFSGCEGGWRVQAMIGVFFPFRTTVSIIADSSLTASQLAYIYHVMFCGFAARHAMQQGRTRRLQA
jgi:hypothetical protein